MKAGWRILIWMLAAYGFGWAIGNLAYFTTSLVMPELTPRLADVPTLLRVHGMLASLICAAACFHIWRKS